VNVAVTYMYRDGGNYKTYHTVIFGNTNNIALHSIATTIATKLIDGIWFYSSKWNLPNLHFDNWDEELDHQWNELCSIEETDEPETSGDILWFLERLA
jgi:hypothetical protein